jgi:hypothetical protein
VPARSRTTPQELDGCALVASIKLGTYLCGHALLSGRAAASPELSFVFLKMTTPTCPARNGFNASGFFLHAAAGAETIYKEKISWCPGRLAPTGKADGQPQGR